MTWVDWTLQALTQWDGTMKLFIMLVVVSVIGTIATAGRG